MTTVTITDIQMFNINIVGVLDQGGQPVGPGVVDPSPVPTWSTSNPSIISLTPSPDGMSCLVTAVGPVGSATVTVAAFYLTSPISTTITVVVSNSAPASVALLIHDPQNQ